MLLSWNLPRADSNRKEPVKHARISWKNDFSRTSLKSNLSDEPRLVQAIRILFLFVPSHLKTVLQNAPTQKKLENCVSVLGSLNVGKTSFPNILRMKNSTDLSLRALKKSQS